VTQTGLCEEQYCALCWCIVVGWLSAVREVNSVKKHIFYYWSTNTLNCHRFIIIIIIIMFLRIKYKNTNHQQMHKESFIINRNTLLHVSTLPGHLQGELSVIVTLRLHFIVEWECAVDCVLPCTTDSSRLQCTVHSTFSLNYKVQP
jgi:hypothetical protein